MNKTFNNLPLYEAKITNEDEGLITLSLVTFPAVESNFYCFKKDRKPQMFSIESAEERIISGVVMLANTPIYRRNGDFEYYITYSRETIKKMASKMLADGTFKNISLQHDGNLIEGVSMVELFIKDENKGLSPNYVVDIPDGSLMASYHVENADLWDEIKNNDMLNGFSLEGLFDVEPIQMNKQNKTQNTMNKFAKFVRNLIKYGSAETDKGNLYWEGDGEIETGLEVYVENEEGLKEAAEDGEYTYEDKIIVVKDGKIDSIKDKEEEETSVEEEISESVSASKFAKIKAAFEESYEEKEQKIIAAIRAAGYADSYLIEAGDDYAVIDAWDEEAGNYKTIRFAISWSEDGEVEVGDSEEVKPAFVPVDTDVEEIAEDEEKKEEEFEDETPAADVDEIVEEAKEVIENDYEDRIKALEDKVKELEDAIAKLSDTPAADTIEEEFEVVARKQNFKGNKAAKLFSHLNN